jgi:hypothetical protein
VVVGFLVVGNSNKHPAADRGEAKVTA